MISWDWLKYIATAALDAAYLSESDTTRHAATYCKTASNSIEPIGRPANQLTVPHHHVHHHNASISTPISTRGQTRVEKFKIQLKPEFCLSIASSGD